MSHYDLYKALGISPSLSTEQIADHLASRLSDQPPQGQVDELRLALDVIGNDERRTLYDRQLRNPSAPEITVEAVRQLTAFVPARHESSGHTPLDGPAVARCSEEPAASGRRQGDSPSWLAPGVVVVAIVALTAVIITWIITSGDDPAELTADGNTGPTFTYETTTEPEDTDTQLPAPTSPQSPDPSSDPSSDLTEGTIVPTGERIDTFGWVGDEERMPNCEGHPGDWVFAASNGQDRVIICQTSDDLHYKGFYNGGFGSRKIDTAKSGIGKYYTTTQDFITKGESRWVFEITDSGLTFKDPSNYEEKPGRNFTWSCERRSPTCEFYDPDMSSRI